MSQASQVNCKFLSGSMLKLFAIVFMTIDHTALVFAPMLNGIPPFLNIGGNAITLYWVLRKIGRLAFPIFCFLIAEGFLHTRNRPKYALLLFLFALLSEIPFDLMTANTFFNWGKQNVYFTLLGGLLLIYVFEICNGELKCFLAMAAIGFAVGMLKPDYGLSGVLLVFVFHIFRSHPALQAILAFPMLSGGLAAFCAFIPINMYNGRRGFIKTPVLKLLFYSFYPLHIWILIGLRYLIA